MPTARAGSGRLVGNDSLIREVAVFLSQSAGLWKEPWPYRSTHPSATETCGRSTGKSSMLEVQRVKDHWGVEQNGSEWSQPLSA